MPLPAAAGEFSIQFLNTATGKVNSIAAISA
jgi:hypothetical protein